MFHFVPDVYYNKPFGKHEFLWTNLNKRQFVTTPFKKTHYFELAQIGCIVKMASDVYITLVTPYCALVGHLLWMLRYVYLKRPEFDGRLFLTRTDPVRNTWYTDEALLFFGRWFTTSSSSTIPRSSTYRRERYGSWPATYLRCPHSEGCRACTPAHIAQLQLLPTIPPSLFSPSLQNDLPLPVVFSHMYPL